MAMPSTHAALDEYAADHNYTWSGDGLTVAQKQSELQEAGLFDESDAADEQPVGDDPYAEGEPQPMPAERTLETELDKGLSEILTYGEEGSLIKQIPQPEEDETEEDNPVIEKDTESGLVQLTRPEAEGTPPEPDTSDLGEYVTSIHPIKARAQSAEAHAKLEALEEVNSG
jgi:hypothetical protein